MEISLVYLVIILPGLYNSPLVGIVREKKHNMLSSIILEMCVTSYNRYLSIFPITGPIIDLTTKLKLSLKTDW